MNNKKNNKKVGTFGKNDVIKKLLMSSDFSFHQLVHSALVHTCDKFQGKSIRNGEVMEGVDSAPRF